MANKQLTVAKLIELLENAPKDAPVVIGCEITSHYSHPVWTVNADHEKGVRIRANDRIDLKPRVGFRID